MSTVRGTVISSLRHNWVWVAAAVMVVLGLLGWSMALAGSRTPEATNRAVIDKPATAKVSDAVSRSLTQVLSYDYQTPQATEQAADQLLSGQALKEFHTLFKTLAKKAPHQKLTLKATVTSIGVKQLDADSAKLLVFLDQSSKRASDKQATVSAAQLSVSAAKRHGHWTITGLVPL